MFHVTKVSIVTHKVAMILAQSHSPGLLAASQMQVPISSVCNQRPAPKIVSISAASYGNISWQAVTTGCVQSIQCTTV